MNKKLNTVLFILIATVVNILVMFLLFLFCLFLISTFVNPESSLLPLWIGLTFLISIGGSFFLYTVAMKKISQRYDLEQYLHPIFSRRRTGKKQEK